MTPQYLRARITPQFKRDREAYLRTIVEEERLWEQGLPLIQYQDDLDERHLAQGQSVRSAHNAQRRGIERLFRLMCDSAVTAYWPDFTEEEQKATSHQLYDHGWKHTITHYFDTLMPATPEREVRIARNRKDVKENFLYEEWLRQINKQNGCRTYATYALFTCLRSAFILMVAKPGGSELIATFYTGPLPDREELVQVKEILEVTTIEQNIVMSWLLGIEYMLELAEALMLHYSDFVRAERVDKSFGHVVDSPLPDDPREETLPERYEIPLDIRIESAVQGYIAKEGGADVVADRYQLPQKMFRQVLRDRGLISNRGGDRKGKK